MGIVRVEPHHQGFDRCHTYDGEFDGYSRFIIAHWHVDVEIASWWSAKMEKDITFVSWEDFKKFLCACFMPSSMMVSCQKAMINMEAIKQPPKVMLKQVYNIMYYKDSIIH
jgi:hypothetical protein